MRALWAALTLAFHGFLRASELTFPTSTAYSPHQHLLRRGIRLHKHCLVIAVKASKSDHFRATCTLPVAATGTTTCPVRAIREFFSHARHHQDLPLFSLSSGEFLTRGQSDTHPLGAAPSCWDVAPRGPPVREPQPANQRSGGWTPRLADLGCGPLE